MTTTEHKEVREELEACRNILRGKTVNGVKLGDAGITHEWLARTIANLERMLANDSTSTEWK